MIDKLLSSLRCGDVQAGQVQDISLLGNGFKLTVDVPSQGLAEVKAAIDRISRSREYSVHPTEKKMSLLFPQCTNLHRVLTSLRSEARTLDSEIVVYAERAQELQDQLTWIDDATRAQTLEQRSTSLDNQIAALDRSAAKIQSQMTAADSQKVDADAVGAVAGEVVRIAYAGNSEAVNNVQAQWASYVQTIAAKNNVAPTSQRWRDFAYLGEKWRTTHLMEKENARIATTLAELELRKEVDYAAASHAAKVTKGTLEIEKAELGWRRSVTTSAIERHQSLLSRASRNFVDRYLGLMHQYVEIALLLERQSHILAEAMKDRCCYDVSPQTFDASEFFGDRDESLLSDYAVFLSRLSCDIDRVNASMVHSWVTETVSLKPEDDHLCGSVQIPTKQGALLMGLSMVASGAAGKMARVLMTAQSAQFSVPPSPADQVTPIEVGVPVIVAGSLADLDAIRVSGGLLEEMSMPEGFHVCLPKVSQLKEVTLLYRTSTSV